MELAHSTARTERFRPLRSRTTVFFPRFLSIAALPSRRNRSLATRCSSSANNSKTTCVALSFAPVPSQVSTFPLFEMSSPALVELSGAVRNVLLGSLPRRRVCDAGARQSLRTAALDASLHAAALWLHARRHRGLSRRHSAARRCGGARYLPPAGCLRRVVDWCALRSSELHREPQKSEIPDLSAMISRVRGTYHRLIGSGCDDMHK